MPLPALTIDRLIQKMLDAVEQINNYQCLTEGYSSRGEKEGWRTTEYKYNKNPEMVAGKIIKNKSNYKSRSMPGSRYLLKDGKIEARLTGLLSLIPFKTRADDKLAMWHRGERLDQSHIVHFAKQAAADHKNGLLTLAPASQTEGKEMHVLHRGDIDPRSNFGITSRTIHIDPHTFYVVKLENFESGNPKPVSSWTIKDIRTNTNLKQSDFKL